jgi:hypothetical protein
MAEQAKKTDSPMGKDGEENGVSGQPADGQDEMGIANPQLPAAAGGQGVTEKDVALYAHYCRQLVIEYKDGVNKNLWALAKVLKEIRDEKLYRMLDCGSFNEFVAQPEIGMSRSAVYALIKRYEIYAYHLNVPENRLLNIDSSKLDIIAPVVKGDPEKWLASAEALSQSDLINEVRVAQGRGEMDLSPPLPSQVSAPAPFSSYEDYVRGQPCCVCGKGEESDYAHFPRTKAAGGKFGIPLCRLCHSSFHSSTTPGLWVWNNRKGWGTYLEGLIQSIGRGKSD